MKREPLWRRYARLWGKDPGADAEDELSFHYEMRVRDYVRRGMDEASARAAASRRPGDVAAVREACAELGARTVRSDRRREGLGELRQDVKRSVLVLKAARLRTQAAGKIRKNCM
ncbi:MAG: permease prefix domain 1-containing protein [Longimicrobiales bacterium]